MRETVIIAGSLAQKPRQGGHAWVFLQYALGFRKLGWDVLFVDQLEPGMCVDWEGKPCPPEKSANLEYFQRIVSGFGFDSAYALLCDQGRRQIGMTRQELLHRTSEAALLLNVMGFLGDREILDRAGQRVFLDIDPGFGQMWEALGLCSMFEGHDRYVTIGENVGRPGCAIPTCGIDWITTPQPVVLDHWKPGRAAATRGFTTVGSWRGAYGPVPYEGKTYGLRVHEFRKFAALPCKAKGRFEAALDLHPSDAADRDLLEQNGWSLTDPRAVAADPWIYRDYIAQSQAEFMVAKNMYVDTASGWFSDRSICYLASGKPVLAQDTGLTGLLPTKKGLVTFRSLEEAAAGAEEIARDYGEHARAAREIAVEHFDSSKVLCRLLRKLSVN